MIKTNKVKDNIHGYIYYSNLESLFISHRLVLRLHYIRQNGAAYLTYPSIRVHRYEHSLGAMHLAGQLLLNAIRFSSNMDGLLEVAKKIIPKIAGEKNMDGLRNHLVHSGESGEIDFIKQDGLYHLNSLSDFEDDNCLATMLMYQAVRIAMLVHDIGHPPFSHTFEMGLKQLAVEYDDHERVGLDLLEQIILDIEESTWKLRFHFAKIISKLVRAIIDKNDSNHGLLKGVAEIVSGDVDADRLDYVKRDALSGGLSTNSYDIGRLFDALKLVPNEAGEIALVYHAAALSTLEAFFGMRFHLYRWMLWHHSVIMQNMVLVSLTHSLSELSSASLGKLSHAAKEIMDIAIDPSRRRDYWYFTDNFLMTHLTGLRNDLLEAKKDSTWLRRLYVDLETFLFRRKDFIRPFWKRPDDYSNFASSVTGEALLGKHGGGAAQTLNLQLQKRFNMVMEDTRTKIADKSLPAKADNIDYHSRAFCKEIERVVNQGLSPESGRVRAYYLAKFKPAPKDMYLFSGKEQYPLAILSPSITALDQAWNSLPQLWFFLDRCRDVKIVDKDTIKPDISTAEPKDVMANVAESLKKFLDESAAA